MKNNSLKLLEEDWDALLLSKNYLDLGKCLRAIVKCEKNAGQLSHKAYEINQRIKVLETNLNAVEPRARFTIIGDCLYARRAIESSSTEDFGGAFRKSK
jgi:hypothetical protein